MVDAHCHLQHHAFADDLPEVLDRARAAGIERILVPGWDVASSEAALELVSRYPDLLDAAVGVHPHHAAEVDEAGWARIEELAQAPQVVAIGEIGLDFFRDLAPRDRQRAAFERQLGLAAAVGKPVVVHDRDAHDELLASLLAWSAPLARDRPSGMLHAYSGDAAMADALAAAGFLVSFALPLAFRSASGPRAAAPSLPSGALLVETDSPYLGPDRDRRNEPTTALRVATELAWLRGEPVDELAAGVAGAYARLTDR